MTTHSDPAAITTAPTRPTPRRRPAPASPQIPEDAAAPGVVSADVAEASAEALLVPPPAIAPATTSASAAVDAAEVPVGPKRYINRELSWLGFNDRVLQEAANPRHPLLERLRFLAISGSNLDEFYMVRVAGLRAMVRAGVGTASQDGLTPQEQLDAIHRRAAELVDNQQALWRGLVAELAGAGICVVSAADVTNPEREALRAEFMARVFPLLTPLAVDPAHPFPFIHNLGFALALDLRAADGARMTALTPIPNGVERFLEIPRGAAGPGAQAERRFIAIEQAITLFADALFPGYRLRATGAFRVIRDSDIEIEEEAADLVEYFETALKRRRRGVIVRLTIEASMPEDMREFILREIETEPQDVMTVDGILGIKDLSQLIVDGYTDLKFTPFEPRYPERIRDFGGDLFAAIRAKDILVHHPYETFDTVIGFLRQAASDPNVLAIRQTLYRTSRASPIVAALCEAADAGKSVTAVVEIKARFDEETNLALARELERHGVQVVFGFLEYKTHAKLSIVLRREAEGLRTYTHIGTGNYHPQTARVYTDLSLFTADAGVGRDAVRVFNFVTGYAKPATLEHLALAPLTMKSTLLGHIDTEIANAKAGKPSGVWAKMNSLVDPEVIEALYRASQAGVPVDLVIRGICCLRPGLKGLSETIRVKSIVGRFLEHSRIVCFGNGHALPSPQARVYFGSADWMPRNLDRRVEVMTPALNPTVHRQILEQVMAANLADEAQSWTMGPDGAYTRVNPCDPNAPFSAHEYFMQHPSLSGRGRAREAAPPPDIARVSGCP